MSLGSFHNPYPEIRRLAQASKDEELCGLLLDDGKQGLEFLRCANVHQEPSANFGISSAALLMHRQRLQAIVHHHPPGCLTEFSEKDLRSSDVLNIPFVLYVTETDKFHRYRPPLIRRNFVDRGFLFSVQDCVTLVCDWVAEVKRLTLPLFSTDKRELITGIAGWREAIESIGLVRHEEPQPESVAGFRCGDNGAVSHCGIVTKDMRLLHQWAGHRSEIVMLTDDWKSKAAGYWA